MSVALRAAWKGIVRVESHLRLAVDNSQRDERVDMGFHSLENDKYMNNGDGLLGCVLNVARMIFYHWKQSTFNCS